MVRRTILKCVLLFFLPLLSSPHTAWDNDTIEHWKVDEFKPGDMAHSLTEESSFATLFPKYREKYLQKVWPHVTRSLKEHVSVLSEGHYDS